MTSSPPLTDVQGKQKQPAKWRLLSSDAAAPRYSGGKLANWLLYLTVGYGYRTWLAGVWLAGLLALGTWIFGSAYPAHMSPAGAHPAAFHPLAYTLSVLLPFGNSRSKIPGSPQGWAMYWSWVFTAAAGC